MLYKFCYEDNKSAMFNITKNGEDVSIYEIEDLLDEYCGDDCDDEIYFDIERWIDFLKSKGYNVKGIKYYVIYF